MMRNTTLQTHSAGDVDDHHRKKSTYDDNGTAPDTIAEDETSQLPNSLCTSDQTDVKIPCTQCYHRGGQHTATLLLGDFPGQPEPVSNPPYGVATEVLPSELLADHSLE